MENLFNKKKQFNVEGIISIFIALSTLVFTIQFNLDTRRYQEELNLNQTIQASIPVLRVSDYAEAEKTISIYPPYREPSALNAENGIVTESYFSIKNFAFENMADNIAFINHIEYGGEAFELNNSEIATIKGESVSFLSENLFVGAKFESCFYIIAKSEYGKYYSYKCNMSPNGKEGNTYCYEVKSIDMPVEYNIDNEIYNSRYVHYEIKLYPDHIIF